VPFEADSMMAVVVKHITEPPLPPSQINPNVPAEVERVILTAMDKNPDSRFHTAEEMVAALIRAATPSIVPSATPSVDLAARSAARSLAARPGLLQSLPVKARRFGANVKGAAFRLSGRGRIALGGAALLIALVLLFVWGSQALKPPVTQAGLRPTDTPTPLPATATQMPTTATATSILAATPTSASTSVPTFTLTTTLTPTVTPALTLLSDSASIRAGIYVKAIKPEGVVLRKGAGFDSDYYTTLPLGTVLYVLQGPVSADSLQWLRLSSGAWSGWARQDEVVAYAVKKTP